MFSIKTHNGEITIKNRNTGDHRTFAIKTQAEDARFAPGKRVAYLLSGPSDYSGFGFVNADGTISVWKSKRGSGHFETYARMLAHPERYEGKGAEYMFAGTCRKCNRQLTNPDSIESGIGPVCAGR